MIIEQTEQTATGQIIARADETIAELEQQFTENAGRISELQAEMSALTESREMRFQQLKRVRAQVASLENQHSQAQRYVDLAKHTIRENDALTNLSAVKKTWQEEKKSLGSLERETIEADKLDRAGEQELTSALQELLAEQERIQIEMQGIEEAKRIAHAAEGQEKYNAISWDYRVKLAQVATLEKQLLEAKGDLLEAHTQALESLKNWPELRQRIAQHKEPDDATLRILKANLAYVDLLDVDADKVVPHPILRSLPHGGLWPQLAMGKEMEEWMSDQWNTKAWHQRLTSRRYILTQILSEYVELKKQRGY